MKKVIFVIIISSIFLSSCNTIRSSAGVERKVIDEYNVVENPPLVIPPNFNLLPPDQIESKDIDDTDSELAKEILFGLDEESDETPSENSVIDNILKETEADQVDNSIREDLDGNSEDEISQDNTDVESENIEEPKNSIQINAIYDKVKKITTPIPSLKRDSPAILVSAVVERFIFLTMESTAIGSVGAINAPKSRQST